MVALSETIADHAKRLVRQRLAETPEAAILMSADARAKFLGSVDAVLAAASSPWTGSSGPLAWYHVIRCQPSGCGSNRHPCGLSVASNRATPPGFGSGRSVWAGTISPICASAGCAINHRMLI